MFLLNLRKLCLRVITALLVAILAAVTTGAQAPAPQQSDQSAPRRAVHSHRPTIRSAPPAGAICTSCVRENLAYLAGPELHGRGSGTEDERRAAQFIAAKLKSYGLMPAAGPGQFVQTGDMRTRSVIGNPTLTVEPKSAGNGKPLVLTHGKQIAIASLTTVPVSGTLQRLDLSDGGDAKTAVAPGTMLLVRLAAGASVADSRALLEPYRTGNAALIVIAVSLAWQHSFESWARQPPEMRPQVGSDPETRVPLVLAKQKSFEQLWGEADGASVTLNAKVTPWKVTHTWNVLGKIEGASASDEVVLLSAHFDHLGVENGTTYYGADDDASGTTAVMELARVLASGPLPKRTVIVALWGSEETGLIGAHYFLQNPTFPLSNIVANLEFEMIGRPDPKLKPDELWLTGWDRTNLGPELAQRGANLVADPHPDQKFFTRSDNYALAQQGIVAQTISSFGLHSDYHQPTDTVDKIDFKHMDDAITSMIAPLNWLVNTDFTPEWAEGKKP